MPRQLSNDFIGMKEYNRPIGFPDQMQIHENVWISLTKTLQDWYFSALCLYAYGTIPNRNTAKYKEAVTQWAWLMEGGVCWNNGEGWRPDLGGKADYIQGKNLGASPMKWEPLILGGNQVEVIGTPITIRKKYLKWDAQSLVHYPIRVLDPAHLPTVESFLSDARVCHKATTIRPDGGKWVFPQFGEKTIYPLWAVGGRAWVWERLISEAI